MKKLFSIILCIMFILLSGCSEKDNAPVTENTEATISVTETVEVPTEALPETTAPVLQTYPLNPGMAYYEYAAQLPDHIYNTLGSENGLEGTIYAFDGVVISTEEFKTGGFTYDCATVETAGGSVFIMNMYKTVCGKGGKALYSDNENYYIFPEIGEPANFLAVYMGYSNVKEMPTFIFGASADVLDIGDYDDPVAAELAAIANP